MLRIWTKLDLPGDQEENAQAQAQFRRLQRTKGRWYFRFVRSWRRTSPAWSRRRRKCSSSDLGLEESGLDRLIRVCYDLLGLMSYLTAGEQEVRAWTIEKGTKAPQAAGKIHTDFERGFIRAEVVSYDDLMTCGSLAAAREKGLVRSEGKEYVMQDGDVVLFRFNV